MLLSKVAPALWSGTQVGAAAGRGQNLQRLGLLLAIGQRCNGIVIQSVLPIALDVAETDIAGPSADLPPQAACGNAAVQFRSRRRSSSSRFPTPRRQPPRARRPRVFRAPSSSQASSATAAAASHSAWKTGRGARESPFRTAAGSTCAVIGNATSSTAQAASQIRASAHFVERQRHQSGRRRQQGQDVPGQLVDRDGEEQQHGQRPDGEERRAAGRGRDLAVAMSPSKGVQGSRPASRTGR